LVVRARESLASQTIEEEKGDGTERPHSISGLRKGACEKGGLSKGGNTRQKERECVAVMGHQVAVQYRQKKTAPKVLPSESRARLSRQPKKKLKKKTLRKEREREMIVDARLARWWPDLGLHGLENNKKKKNTKEMVGDGRVEREKESPNEKGTSGDA